MWQNLVMWQKLCLVIAMTIATIGGEVHASIVIFKFQGEVLGLDPLLASEFSVGEEISGTYAFDSNATASVNGDFPFSVVSFEGFVGDYNFKMVGLGDISLNGGYSVIGSTEGNSVGVASPILHALQFAGGSLPLGALPLTPPDLSQFSSLLFTLDFLDPIAFPPPRLVGRIDSLTIVPEPSHFLIGMLGLVTVAIRRRGRTAAHPL